MEKAEQTVREVEPVKPAKAVCEKQKTKWSGMDYWVCKKCRISTFSEPKIKAHCRYSNV